MKHLKIYQGALNRLAYTCHKISYMIIIYPTEFKETEKHCLESAIGDFNDGIRGLENIEKLKTEGIKLSELEPIRKYRILEERLPDNLGNHKEYFTGLINFLQSLKNNENIQELEKRKYLVFFQELARNATFSSLFPESSHSIFADDGE